MASREFRLGNDICFLVHSFCVVKCEKNGLFHQHLVACADEDLSFGGFGHPAAGEVAVEAHADGGGSFARCGDAQAGFVGGKAGVCGVKELEECSAFGVLGEDVECFAFGRGRAATRDGDEFVVAESRGVAGGRGIEIGRCESA